MHFIRLLGLIIKIMRALTIFSLAVLTFIIVGACKSARLGPTYPIDDFSEYDFIIIATVDKAVHSKEGYQGIKTFNITVKNCLKGDLQVNKQISGKDKVESPQAVCPVHLKESEDYLLLLTRSIGSYRLSRFSFPVKKGHKYFNDYLVQIKEKLNSNKNH